MGCFFNIEEEAHLWLLIQAKKDSLIASQGQHGKKLARYLPFCLPPLFFHTTASSPSGHCIVWLGGSSKHLPAAVNASSPKSKQKTLTTSHPLWHEWQQRGS